MLKSAIFVLFILMTHLSLPAYSIPLCIEILKPHPASLDPYRAYAIGKKDTKGVQRIHVVDFTQRTQGTSMNVAALKKTILNREKFNFPETKISEIEQNFIFYRPKAPLQTRAEMKGKNGQMIRKQILQTLEQENFNRLSHSPKSPLYEYEPADSKKMTFMVELKTPDGLIELIFTKYVNYRHMDTQATSYALHIANQLGLQVESIWAVRFGYKETI